MFQFRTYRVFATLVGVVGLSVLSVSCGDRALKRGHLHDSAVIGVYWETETLSGFTTSGGRFNYRYDEEVSFSLGAISLGRGQALDDMTIVDIVDGASGVEDDAVTNIARLLQTLDSDGDLDNGINISDFVIQQATVDIDFDQSPTSFENDPDVISLLNDATGSQSLTSVDTAQTHLQATIDAIAASSGSSSEDSPPEADAGNDERVVSGEEVTLSGSGEDDDGTIESLVWEVDGANADVVALIDDTDGDESHERTVIFTAPDVNVDTILTFILTVTDDDGFTDTDRVSITIEPGS
ncbi:MAG: hypothetical protein JKY24_00420 [Pseudomonadales bacterium]|nr:hypothetical protein [Pseudomonadales bacterium]